MLYQRRGSGGATPVIDPVKLAELNRMLLAVVEYGTGKSAKLDRMAAGKTGTSQELPRRLVHGLHRRLRRRRLAGQRR